MEALVRGPPIVSRHTITAARRSRAETWGEPPMEPAWRVGSYQSRRIAAFWMFALLLPFATGLALVLHILLGTSLFPVVGASVAFGSAGFAYNCRQLTPSARRRLAHRVRAAALAALVATVAYDVSRLALSATLIPSVDPFAAWPIFGELVVGASRGVALRTTVGMALHIVNGVGFGVAYAMVMPRPGVTTGILWGLGLEFAMALLYPSWLRIEALGEFLTLSVLGHVAYGATLGVVTRGLTRRSNAGSAARSGA